MRQTEAAFEERDPALDPNADTRFGVAEYVLNKQGLDTIELKWGQGAKCISGEIRVGDLA